MTHRDNLRLFVSFPESLVDRPLIYEIVKELKVNPYYVEPKVANATVKK